MLKTLITIILPFFGPLIAYSLWQKIVMRKHKKPMNNSIISWCLLLGAVLAVLSIFVFGLHITSKDPSVYHPPRYQDGQIIPGDFY